MGESKICAVSGKQFTIRNIDLAYYERISPRIAGTSYHIPSPTLCPEERDRRRLSYRNERNLYRASCAKSGSPIISCYPPNSAFPVYSREQWWQDDWNAADFAQAFDFTRSFFEQFTKLRDLVPRPGLINNNAENSEYCNFADDSKNCYLCTSSVYNEDCYYCSMISNNTNVVDTYWVVNSELVYESTDCRHCYHLLYAQNCEHCSESAFLLDCRSVQNCLFCIGLRNKKYHIFNKPCSREEYQSAMAEFSSSYQKTQQAIKRFEAFKAEYPYRRANNLVSCENVYGDNIFNCKNTYMTFDLYRSEDCAYLHDGIDSKSCYDCIAFADSELCYESNSLLGYGYRFTNFCRGSTDLYYCDNCHSCRNCFGCVGLRNAEYSILNTKFSKEQYEQLLPKVIEHMRRIGEWGEFFPMQDSPFFYNETLAQDFFPISKETAAAQGLPWQDDLTGDEGEPVDILPDSIAAVSDEILTQVITCNASGKKFKIQKAELEFYRKLGIPLPRICFNERHLARLARRNPRELFNRSCAETGKPLVTSYHPDRPEIVLCEDAYLQQVD